MRKMCTNSSRDRREKVTLTLCSSDSTLTTGVVFPLIHPSTHPSIRIPFQLIPILYVFLSIFILYTLDDLTSEIQVANLTANNSNETNPLTSWISIKQQWTNESFPFHFHYFQSFRLFKIRLRRSANDVFTDDAQIESSTGPIYYNMDNIYHGQMEGYLHTPSSSTKLIFRNSRSLCRNE